MRKKFATLFLLLVLSIQTLPVRQMGLALFSNQFTEELPHAFETGKDCCKKADCKSEFLSPLVLALNTDLINASALPQVAAVAIPLNHTGDIHVPPPNC